MNRRRFVVAIAGGLVIASRMSDAQPQGKVWRIGYLGGSDQAASGMRAFHDGMRELGYVEGRDYVQETRWGRGDPDRAAALAAELIGLKIDILIAATNPSIRAAKQATTSIPIVMLLAGDPIGSGFIASLRRPGANITGLTGSVDAAFLGKCLEVLKAAVPTASRVTLLANLGRRTDTSAQIIAAAAQSLGVRLQTVAVREATEVETALRQFSATTTDAAFVVSSPVLYGKRDAIIAWMAKQRLPAVYDSRTWVEAGGLLSYGSSWADLTRRTASYVDRIIKGAKPGDLPVEQPTKFELVVNLKSAKALDLTIPQSLLLRADEVIQ